MSVICVAVGVGEDTVAAPGRQNPRIPAPVSNGSQWLSVVHTSKSSHATPSFAGWQPVPELQTSHVGMHGGWSECWHCPVLGLQESVVHGLWSMSGHTLNVGWQNPNCAWPQTPVKHAPRPGLHAFPACAGIVVQSSTGLPGKGSSHVPQPAPQLVPAGAESPVHCPLTQWPFTMHVASPPGMSQLPLFSGVP